MNGARIRRAISEKKCMGFRSGPRKLSVVRVCVLTECPVSTVLAFCHKLVLLTDSLKTSRLKYVILDWTWRDQKLRRMIDIPEVWHNYKQTKKYSVLTRLYHDYLIISFHLEFTLLVLAIVVSNKPL